MTEKSSMVGDSWKNLREWQKAMNNLKNQGPLKKVGDTLGHFIGENYVTIEGKRYPLFKDARPHQFRSIAFPIITRAFPPQLRNSLVSVQPMSVPSEQIFKMDFKYTNKEEDDE